MDSIWLAKYKGFLWYLNMWLFEQNYCILKIPSKGRVKNKIKKVILITLSYTPPPQKVIISFSATRTSFEKFWKKVYFSPWKSPKHTIFTKGKKWVLGKQMLQNVGRTKQNVSHTAYNVSHDMLNVCKGPYPYTWKNFSV